MTHNKWWWAGLLAVMLVGAALLLTGYDAGLPLYESKDERHNLDEVYALRGLSDDTLWKPGYPPGILYVNASAQLLTEVITGDSAWDRACEVIRTVRLEGVVTNLLTGLLVAFTARKLSGNIAGLIAPLGWFVAPRVLGQVQFAFPQVYEGLFYMLALYTAILAVEKPRPRYAVISLLAGLGTVLFKYTTFPVLALGVGAALWNLRHDRRLWLRVLAVQVGLVMLVALALFTLGGAASLIGSGHVEANQFVSGGLSGLLDFDLIHFIFDNGAGQIGFGLFAFTAFIGVGTGVLWPQAATWQRLGWLGALYLGASHLLFLAAYIVFREGIDRNVLSSSSVLAVLLAVAIVAIGREIGARLRRPALAYGFIGVLAVLWLVPQFIGALAWVQYRSLPVTYGDLLVWADQTLPEEAMLVNDWRPFTREWSCYLRTERNAMQFDELTDRPISEWLARDVYYAQLTQDEIEALQATDEGQTTLEQMTLLRRFPPEGEEGQWRTWRRGFETDFSVYRLWSLDPQVRTEHVFGEMIRLLGYDISATTVRAGDTLELLAYWQPIRQPDSDYSVFIHLTPQDTPTPVLAQADGVPSRSNFRSTVTWRDMDETFISRPFELAIPEDTEPGAYTLRLGLYDWQTGQRLLTDEGQDHITIPVVVEVASQP